MSDDDDTGGEVVPFKQRGDLVGPSRDEKPKCGAPRPHKGGKPCGNDAGAGTSHPGRGPCKFHYGNTPSANKKAAREAAAELAHKYGQPIDIDPGEALLEEVQRTAGIVRWIGHNIQDWQMSTEAALPDHMSGWMQTWMAERGHLAKVAKMALDAGVARRSVELAEEQGEQLAAAIREILDGLNLTGAQKEVVPELVPRVLRQLMEADSAG